MARTGPLLTPFWVPHSVLLWLFVGVGGGGRRPQPQVPPPHSWAFSWGLGFIGGSLA